MGDSVCSSVRKKRMRIRADAKENDRLSGTTIF